MSEPRRFRGNSTLRSRSASSSATSSPSTSHQASLLLAGNCEYFAITVCIKSSRTFNGRSYRPTGAVRIGERVSKNRARRVPGLILIYILDTIAPIKKLRYKNYGGEYIYQISLIMYGLCQSLAYQICHVKYYYPEPLNFKPKAGVRRDEKTHRNFVQSRLINRQQQEKDQGETGGRKARKEI